MPKIKIKQLEGTLNKSVLFVGDNNVISEDFHNLNWDYANKELNLVGKLNTNSIKISNLVVNESLGKFLVSDIDGNISYRNSGADGTSGTSGVDGTSGTSGTSGIDGANGTSGSSGTSGVNGTSGSSGSSGVDSGNLPILSTILPNSIGLIYRAPTGKTVREIGNIIKSTIDNFYYHVITDVDTATNSQSVKLLKSPDLITWTDQGNILTDSEDPYLVEYNNGYYIYVEDKAPVTYRNIKLYTSSDLITWTDQGIVLSENGATWESQDVSSPVVKIVDGIWYMWYEGRSSTQEGAIGIATSSDGITWTKDVNNPIFTGTNLNSDIKWADHIVPDDIIKIDGFYYMTAHANILPDSDPNNEWYNAVLVSRDMVNWVDMLGTWTNRVGYTDESGYGTMLYKSEDYGIIASFVNEGNEPDQDQRNLIFGSFGVSTKLNNSQIVKLENDFVTLDTPQTITSNGLKTVQVAGKSWIFETTSNKITLGGNDDSTVLQPEAGDNGNLTIYGTNDVKIIDIDGNFDDISTGIQGGYVGVYRGGNGAYCASLGVNVQNKTNSLDLNEYSEANFGDPTNPTSNPNNMLSIYSTLQTGGTQIGGIEINNPNGRFDLGHPNNYTTAYKFVNAFKSLFEDDIEIKQNLTSTKRIIIGNNGIITGYGQNIKTVDIDTDFSNGGYVGTYHVTNQNAGTIMRSYSNETGTLHRNIVAVNHLDPTRPDNPITDQAVELYSWYENSTSYNGVEIKAPNPELVIGGSATKTVGAYHLDVRTGNSKFGGNVHIDGSLGVGVAPNTSINGEIAASNDIIAYASDERLKENKINISNSIDKIKTLNGFTYNWNELAEKKAGFSTTQNMVGVSAQDLQKVLPEAVKLAPFDRDENNESISGEDYLTVQYDKIVPLLIEGMKEQQSQIDLLKEEINKLKK